MKLLFITSLYKPYTLGGTEVVVQTLVDECKKNHEVSVISISEWSGFASCIPKKKREDGVDIYRFFPLNFCSFVRFLKKNVILRMIWHVFDVFNVHSFLVVFSLLKKVNPDVVYTHNLKGIGYLIPLALRIARKKHIHTVHDFALLTPSGVVTYGKENSFEHVNPCTYVYKKINCALYGSPKRVIFPSLFLKKYYQERGFFKKSKVDVIPNPLPHHFEKYLFENPTKKRSVPTQLLFVGQLEDHKGIHFLLETIQKIKKADINLTIIGRGRQSAYVEESAKKYPSRIHYKGALESDNLIPFFKQAHFLLVPSLYYENSPMVIYESLCLGTPVIASRIGGIPELIQNEKNGFLFSPGSEEELLDILERCSMIEDSTYLSQNAQKSVQEMVSKKYVQKLFLCEKN